MKRFIVLVAWLWLLVPAMAVAGPELVMPETLAVIDQPVYQGQDLKADMTVENKGDAELVIEKVVPG